MELQEAKSIYHALRNDYRLFVGDKKIVREIADGRDLYTVFGVYDDIKPYLPKGQVALLNKVVEKNADFYKHWNELHEEIREKKSEIEYNKLLTRRQKEEELLSLREQAEKKITKLNNLAHENQADLLKANEFVIEFLEIVEKALKTAIPKELYPKNLYDLDTISPIYKGELLNRICLPFVPFEERDWGYYQSKRLEVQFVKFTDKLRKKTVGKFAEDWQQEKYAKQLGYTNATEWKAKKFEDYLEQEDLKQIKEIKKEMAFQKLQEEGGKEKAIGWFDKIINGWRPEEE